MQLLGADMKLLARKKNTSQYFIVPSSALRPPRIKPNICVRIFFVFQFSLLTLYAWT